MVARKAIGFPHCAAAKPRAVVRLPRHGTVDSTLQYLGRMPGCHCVDYIMTENHCSRVLLSSILITLVGLLLTTPARAQQALRWGADPSGGAPYVFNDPNHPDQYIGYEKEIVDALAKAAGRRAEFIPSDWETLVSALQRNSFDVIVNGLEPTADRQKQIQFSKPYYIFQLALTVRKDEQQIHSLADCKNRTVGTLGNTAASRLLQKEGIPSKSYAEPLTAYRDLELKRIDAVIM